MKPEKCKLNCCIVGSTATTKPCHCKCHEKECKNCACSHEDKHNSIGACVCGCDTYEPKGEKEKSCATCIANSKDRIKELEDALKEINICPYPSSKCSTCKEIAKKALEKGENYAT